jgi:long-subunit fatty acid transport protein
VVSLGYTYEVNKRLGLSATYNYQDKDITKPTAPDARVDTLAFGADFKATDDDIFKLKYAPKVEDSTQVTRNTDAWGWELTYTRKLPWDMTAGVGYKFDSVNHKNLSPSREDDNTTWGVQLTKDVGKWLSLEVGYETRDRESSIQSKDASNDSAFIGATWKF